MFRPLLRFGLLLSILQLMMVGNITAQQPVVDSLRKQIRQTNELQEQAELYLELAEEVLGSSVDESLLVIDTLLALGYESGDREVIGRSLIWKARMLGEKYELDSALLLFEEAEKIFKNLNDTFYLSRAYNGKGIIYKYKNDYEKAIELQFEAARLTEELGLLGNLPTIYNSIANIYVGLNNYEKGIELYEKAIAVLEKQGELRPLCGALMNLANILEDDPERQMALYQRAEQIALEHKFHRILAYLYAGIASYYEQHDINVDSQRINYRRAMEFGQLAGDPQMVAYNQLYLGIVDANVEPIAAEANIRSAMQNDYVRGSNILIAEGSFFLSKSLYRQAKFQEAYISLDTALTYYQQVYDESIATAAAEAEAKFETQKKEAQLTRQELELVRQRNQQNRLLMGGLLLLTLTVGLFQYFFYRQKRKKQEVEAALSLELAEADRLRQLDNMKNNFFTNVSHELRTPLTLIISPLEEALKALKQVPLEGHLQLAHRNSRHLLGMVNEILDLSKLEAGKMELEHRTFDLVAAMRRILYSFQSVAELKSIRLDFLTELEAPYWVHSDLGKLEKILNNLLANAVKFTGKDGRIALELQALTSDRVVISVSDDGQGIRAEALPHIFQRFYQAENGNPEGAGAGTGVGLALARQLANLLGGSLTVESEWEKGSTFTLDLVLSPVAAPKPRGEAMMEEQLPTGIDPDEADPDAYVPTLATDHKPHLLIVEDHPEMSQYLADHFSGQYICTIAGNGREALEKLGEEQFDLITSDVMMPEMDGFTLREKINEHEDWRYIPFILLTARSLEADKLKGFQLGIDDYVTKPFSLNELDARMQNLLRNKHTREAWRKEQEDAQPDTPDLSPAGQQLQEAEKLVLAHLDDTEFSVEVLAREMALSSRHLSRVLGKQTGLSPVQFILEIRLQKARQLLESRQFRTVSEVRYEIGIESASYFTRKFTERFGKNPKTYLE